MQLVQDFQLAIESDSMEALELALARFKRLKEVKANGKIEIGFLIKTIKPIGLAAGEKLAAANEKKRSAWLGRLATDEKAAVRSLACYVLGEIGKAEPASIIKIAHRLAADDRWEVRECIANTFDDQIGLTQPEFVYDLMVQWATDPSPNVRRCTTNALMRIGIRTPRKVIAVMEKLRHDESEYVRKNVAFCLQQIAKEKHPILGKGNADNPDVMLMTLAYWVKDANRHNRWIVATTLGNVWAETRLARVLALLRTLANDEDKLVRNAVASSLRVLAKYDAEAVKATAAHWAQDSDERVRQIGERALKKIGDG
jgi:3-methyladenine DNA glycosylase AlkC